MLLPSVGRPKILTRIPSGVLYSEMQTFKSRTQQEMEMAKSIPGYDWIDAVLLTAFACGVFLLILAHT